MGIKGADLDGVFHPDFIYNPRGRSIPAERVCAMTTNTVKSLVMALLVAAGAAADAHAQYYQSNGGRILERDLGVYNSGGLAGRDLNSSFRFAQNVSFGRAGGGFGFMGSLGTSDYSDFVGGLGSNDLRGFRDRSQGSALAGRGVRPSDTASFAQSLTAGTRRPNAFQGTLETPSSTYSKSFQFDTRPDFTGISGAASSSASRRATDALGGNSIQNTNREDRLANRRMGLSGGRGPLTAGDSYGSTRLSASDRTAVDLGSSSQSRRATSPDSLSGMTGRGLQQRDFASGGDNSASPRSLTEARAATERARQSMRDSEKTRAALSPDRVDTSIDTRVPGTTASVDRPGSTAAGVNNSYDKLIERIDRLARPDSTTSPTTTPDRGMPVRPGMTPDLQPGTQPSSGLEDLRTRLQRGAGSVDEAPKTDDRVKPVSGLIGGTDWLSRRSVTLSQTGAVLPSTERQAREAARQSIEREAMGLSPRPDDVVPTDTAPAERRIGLDPDILRGIREAGGIVDTFIPAKAGAKDPFAEHMRAAQEAIQARQFFEADDRFASASSIRPSELSPRVGRLHAQLGGALFRTAAASLRNILRMRPETAAAKYAPALLPHEDRLADLVIRLRESSKTSGQTGRDSALLMSYIGFQTGDATLQAEGIDLLEKYGSSTEADSDPRDAVLARFLREVWAPKTAEEAAREAAEQATDPEQPNPDAPVPEQPVPAPAGETPGK
jgi:hypothetical protein